MLKNKKIIIISLVVLVLMGVRVFIYLNKNHLVKSPDQTVFVNEGKLSFINESTNEIIKTINIEIADNNLEREQGLMWRQSIPENLGMLFIFEEEKPLSFWMKNTYIPLDIIFIDKSMKIVNIKKNTVPESLELIFSEKPVNFVVEVNSGFCNIYNVKIGDKIKFEILK